MLGRTQVMYWFEWTGQVRNFILVQPTYYNLPERYIVKTIKAKKYLMLIRESWQKSIVRFPSISDMPDR